VSGLWSSCRRVSDSSEWKNVVMFGTIFFMCVYVCLVAVALAALVALVALVRQSVFATVRASIFLANNATSSYFSAFACVFSNTEAFSHGLYKY
jgi:hypothetical protein